MVDSKSVKSSGMSVASTDGKKRKSLGAKVKGMVKGIRKSTRNKMKKSGSRNSLTNPSVTSASKSVVQIEIEKEQYAVKDSSKKQATEAAAKKAKTPEKQAVSSTAEAKTFESLQLVLLLMDPTSRRFELLQLEFDSERARVADIIAQIPISVTEADIREQSYKHVLDENATLRDQSTRLMEFCQTGKHVLVAVPEGTPVKDCVRLARPILSDPQVVKMVRKILFPCISFREREKSLCCLLGCWRWLVLVAMWYVSSVSRSLNHDFLLSLFYDSLI